MTITQEVFLPVVISVIATLIVVASRYLLGQVISKLSGVSVRSVRGNWNTKFWDDSTIETEKANVNQVLHWVWGTIRYEHKEKEYAFKGTMRDHILVATYEPRKEPSMLDRGAFTLGLNRKGDCLEGTYSWTDDKAYNPKGGRYEWHKI